MYNLVGQIQLQAPNNAQASRVVNQINRQLQGVAVNVQINANNRQIAQTAQNINSVSNSSKNAAKNVNTLGQALGTATRRFGSVAIITGGFLALTRGVKDALSEAIKFEREVIRISQVTGETTRGLRGLIREVTSLSTSLGVSSKDILTTARTLSQAGFAANEVTRALKVLSQTTLAPTFDSIADTTEGAIALLNQFKAEAAATGDQIKFLENSLGAINEVSKRFAVESSDLISVIRRTGGVFESAGGSLNELLALFTSVRSTTRESADTIATGFRTIFTRIQRVDTIENLKALGIELQDAEGKFVGPLEAIKRLSIGLRSLDPRDYRFNQIVEDLGGFRQIGKVIPLIKQFRVSTEALAAAQQGQNSISEDAEKAQQSLEVRIEKVRQKFAALFREIVDSKGFKQLADIAINLAEALIKVGDALVPLIPALTAFVGVKIGSSLTGFGKGLLGRNSGGPIGFASGGPVLGFNNGGLVPGVGNRDTVSAMLSPGEYVIKKKSVESIGAENLATLNAGGSVQKFALGGLAQEKDVGMIAPDLISDAKKNIKAKTVLSAKGTEGILNKRTGFGPLASKSLEDIFVGKGNKALSQGKLPKRSDLQEIAQRVVGFNSKTYSGFADGVDKSDSDNFKRITNDALRKAIKDSAIEWSRSVGAGINEGDVQFADTFDLPQSFRGQLFESVIAAFNGDPVASEAKENNRPFDFTKGVKGRGPLFKEMSNKGIKYVDAKISDGQITKSEYEKKIASQIATELYGSSEFRDAISSKAKLLGQEPKEAALGGPIQKFREGGGSPEDTVSALLTPGEYVFNSKAADKIGRNNLDEMNRKGVIGFNKGGAVGNVRKFNGGGGVTGGGGLGLEDISTKLILLSGVVGSVVNSMSGLSEETQKATNAAITTFSVYSGIGLEAVNFFSRQLSSGGIAKQQETVASQQAAGGLTEVAVAAAAAATSLEAKSLGDISDVGLSTTKAPGGGSLKGALDLDKLDKGKGFKRLFPTFTKGASKVKGFTSKIASSTKTIPILQGAVLGLSTGFANAAREIALLSASIAKSNKEFADLSSRLASGDISGEEFVSKSRDSNEQILKDFRGIKGESGIESKAGIATGALSGAAAGALAGQLLIPVPVLGAAIGAAIGGIGGGFGGSKAGSFIGEARANLTPEEGVINNTTQVIGKAIGAVSEYQKALENEKKKLVKGQDLSFEALQRAGENLKIDRVDLKQKQSSAQVRLQEAEGRGESEEVLKTLRERVEQANKAVEEFDKTVEASNNAKLDKVFENLAKAGSEGDIKGFNTAIGQFETFISDLDPTQASTYTKELQKQAIAVQENRKAQLLNTYNTLLAARAAEKLRAALDGATDIERITRENSRKTGISLGQNVSPDFSLSSLENTGDLGGFIKEVNNITKGLGPAAQKIGAESINLANQLKSIDTDFLTELSDKLKINPSTDISKIVNNTFAGSSADFRKDLTKVLQEEFKNGIDVNSGPEIRKKVIETFDQGNREWLEAFAKAKAEWFKNVSSFNDAIAQGGKRIQQLREGGGQVEAQRSLQRIELSGREVTAADRERARRLETGNKLLGANRDVTRLGGTATISNSVAGVGQQADNVRLLRAERRNALDAASRGNIDADLKAKTLETSIDSLIDNLKQNADRSKEIGQVLKEYEDVVQQEASKRQAVQKSITDFAFATNEGRQNIQRNYAALNQVLATGSIDSIPDQFRQPVKQILQEFKDVALVGTNQISGQQFKDLNKFFGLSREEISKQGGLTGEQIKKILAARSAVNQGFIRDEKQLKSFFNEDQKTSAEAKAFAKATQEFERIAKEERAARLELIALEREEQKRLFADRNQLEKDFISNLNTIAQQSQKVSQQINADLQKTSDELKRVTDIIQDIKDIEVNGGVKIEGDIELNEEARREFFAELNKILKPQGVNLTDKGPAETGKSYV